MLNSAMMMMTMMMMMMRYRIRMCMRAVALSVRPRAGTLRGLWPSQCDPGLVRSQRTTPGSYTELELPLCVSSRSGSQVNPGRVR